MDLLLTGIIEAAKNQIQDSKVRAEMIKLAIVYRQTERNTFPDFSHQPQIDRNSLYCQKPPQHDELKGLIQTQSSTADPNLFFDPKKTTEGGTLKKGSDRSSCLFLFLSKLLTPFFFSF